MENDEDLYRLYTRLPEEERLLLRLLAVTYAPVKNTQLREILQHTGLPGRALISKPWREEMQREGLLARGDETFECCPEIGNILTWETLRNGEFDRMDRAAEWVLPRFNEFGRKTQIADTAPMRRRIRAAFFRQDVDAMVAALALTNPFDEPPRDLTFSVLGALTPILLDWFDTLATPFRFQILRAMIDAKGCEPAMLAHAAAMLKRPALDTQVQEPSALADLRTLIATLSGQDTTDDHLSLGASMRAEEARAVAHFRHGDMAGCLNACTDALKLRRRRSGSASVYLPGVSGWCYCIALLKQGTPEARRKLDRQIEVAGRAGIYEPMLGAFLALQSFARVWFDQAPPDHMQAVEIATDHVMTHVTKVLTAIWLGESPAHTDVEKVGAAAFALSAGGIDWLAGEFGAVTRAGLPADSIHLRDLPDTESVMLALMPRIEPWERALAALSVLAPDHKAAASEEVTRLVWILERSQYGNRLNLIPKEQKATKRGTWSQGRNVALKRLAERPQSIAGLTAHDEKILRHIDREPHRYGQANWELDQSAAMLAAAGHPLVFFENQLDQPVGIEARHPEMTVRNEGDEVHISIFPFAAPVQGLVDSERVFQPDSVVVESKRRLDVFAFSEEHKQISRILGADGLTVPADAKEKVLESIAAISPLLTIHSDLDGTGTDLERVDTDRHLYLNLQPQGDSIALSAGVQPFGEGPRFLPGEGGAAVITEIDGRRVQANRDLKAERRLLDIVLARCTGLVDESAGRWRFLDLEAALEGLVELQTMEEVVCAWPQGKALTVRNAVGNSSVSLSIREQNDWFEVDGEVRTSEQDVLDLQKLLTIMRNAPGRFIQLGDDEFIALTDSLRQRLDAIRSVFDEGRVPKVAAWHLDKAISELHVDADHGFQAFQDRLQHARDLTPELPGGIMADLRDYQLEGYHWLARLADWGAGACLADDMGLGKTLQSIAMLMLRASAGPALIIAPTTVCQNWLNEVRRFAPLLRASQFGTDNRADEIESQGPGDILVCSYGLLTAEADLFASRAWHTIVADEAQAFKNAGTQRSRAMMRLSGDFRVITTGTPVENHLGELWNLFNFINPGLLGGFSTFSEIFARPIERGDEDAAMRLRNVTRPFILRRLKQDVLKELPPRTDITIRVELNDQEHTLYEALRREAQADLESVEDGEANMIALARITRLRRAVCNPALVLPDANIPSSKLERFGELVTDLLANGHRALVFSQFVAHLQLIRRYLDGEGISYQYLDGSSRPADRTRAVDAFQGGEDDLFLISLKAGGTGLNLTAADFVIHMDPWWNPAVEDQASDRAHRIGQQRPVTVYRLIGVDTIEQKIVELHERKRDLASDLLAGKDAAGRLTFDEMVALIATPAGAR